MAPATEFAYITVREGLERDATDESTPAGKAFQFMVDALLRHKGARECHWGMSIDRPRQLWVFADWVDIQDHVDYRETEEFAKVTDGLAPFVDISAGTQISHVVPTITAAFNQPTHPVVEVLSMAFPSDIDDATKKIVEGQFGTFADKALRAAALCQTIVQGWTAERDVTVHGDADNTYCVFIATISWTSIAQHMENRELAVFKDNVHILRTLPSLKKLDAFHVGTRSAYALRG